VALHNREFRIFDLEFFNAKSQGREGAKFLRFFTNDILQAFLYFPLRSCIFTLNIKLNGINRFTNKK
jgi:hypothetical protein